MYSTKSDREPRRPVIASQLTSLKSFEDWLRTNNFKDVADADGLRWTLTTEGQATPDPSRAYQEVSWHVTMRLTAGVDAASLMAQGVLDPTDEGDARLLGFLGEAPLDLALKPIRFTAPTFESARDQVAAEVLKLREQMGKASLAAVKRQLVARWVDQARAFGERGD